MDSVSHETENFFIQKEKRRKWIFGRLKSKRLPSIKAPLPSKGTTLSEAEQEQSKHALTVAIASAAVAEAAVTAAHVAAEVVCLTGQCKENSEESQPVQTAFRGYLVSLSNPFSLICVTLRPLCIIFTFTAKFLTRGFLTAFSVLKNSTQRE